MTLSKEQRALLNDFRSPLWKDRRAIVGAGIGVETMDQCCKFSQRRRTLNALIRLGYIELDAFAYEYVLTEKGAQFVNCGGCRLVAKGAETAMEPLLS